MAPKTPAASLLSHQPSKEKPENENPSSSDEEDDDDVEADTEEDGEDSDQTEEGSSSEDDEEEDTDLKKVGNNETLIPAVAESDAKPVAEGDDSDSDPDSEGSPSDYKMQPIPKPAATLAKRANPESDVTQTPLRSCKKSKTEDGKANPSSTPGFITRLWTNDDEIAVLNGMIEFRSQKRVDPGSDLGDFHGFVKGNLHADFSKEQLKTKISRLKKRFVTALKRFEHNRSEPVFTKQSDAIAFELSKKIWGASISISKGGKKTTTTKRNNGKGKDAAAAAVHEKEAVKEQNGAEEVDFWSKYKYISESFDNMTVKFPSLAMSSAAANAFKEKLSSIGNADAKQLDDKWRKLIMEEIELNYKMLDLMTQQWKMALDK
ncbi:hypothetical protein ABFX02_08G111800 [Erythranthe guttata]